MVKKLKEASLTTKYHIINFVLRGCLFIGAVSVYVTKRIEYGSFSFINGENMPWYILPVWLFFMVEVVLRFIPTKLDPPGCKKHFKSQFVPTGATEPKHASWKGAGIVGAIWVASHAILGILYHFDVVDKGILVLFMLFYSVCDMICVLFVCPLQKLFMKNRCCADCRIYNWDFAMMFTPLIFIPHFYTWSLVAVSLVLLVKWEYTAFKHPERFAVNTNSCLSCKNCPEKCCRHKKSLKKKQKKVNV